eukprot:gnl/Chilomastix_caulleri/2239.p4 GENE.gnl/Chilomastix_caulleri/2239~~gnl/Chilomastix_caulleri/2239.p4  ORF type:complete len:50 (+),score=13.96 gnl/Chilomastix_caulleri/2239:342-491(+)
MEQGASLVNKPPSVSHCWEMRLVVDVGIVLSKTTNGGGCCAVGGLGIGI